MEETVRAKRFALVAALLVNVVAVSLALPVAQMVSAAGPPVFVLPSNTQGWASSDTRPGGTVSFVADTGAPNGGSGALRLATDNTSTAKADYFHSASQTPLSAVTELGYWTKQVGASLAEGGPSFQLPVFLNGGTSGFTTLVFEPVYNQSQQNVTPNVWQSWDVDAGRFFSTRTVTCTGGTPDPAVVQNTSFSPLPLYSLANIQAMCPNAVVAGYGANVGSGNPAYDVRVDLFNFNGTVYDFELGTDLVINKTAQPDPVNAGSDVTYTITLINTGPGDAPSTVVSDTLPGGTTFVSCASSAGGICGGTGNDRTITFSSLTAGASATILLVANVNSSVADGTTLTNTATVTAYEPDTNLTNNTSAATVAVRNPATPSPTPSPTPTPTPAPTTYTVNASASGPGSISPNGTIPYVEATQASYTATPSGNAIFTGWTLDGENVGTANPFTFTVNENRTLTATFATRPSFGDVPTTDPDYQAITFLAALGVINPRGVNSTGQFQPDRQVARAEVASFIARTFGWDDEFHANSFPDKCDPQGQNCVDDELWNNVAALADYGVVGGYTDPDTCSSAGTESPCYLPRDPVKRVQVVSIVARAFIKQPDLRPTGFWDRQDANGGQYTNVADEGTQRSDLTTYRSNAGPIPGQEGDTAFPDPSGSSTRRFLIQVLYQAYVAAYGTDQVP
jgi:uncharacterized repeat protein (TIGR01451 family)